MKESRIKILYIITRLICGGAQKIVLSLAGGLNKERFEITVACGELSDSERYCQSLLGDKKVKLVIFKQLVRRVSIVNDAISTLRLFLFIRKERFDIVHTHTSKAGALGRLAALLARTPVIIHTPHGSIFDSAGMIPGVSDRSLARPFFLLTERILATFTDIIVTLSDDEKFKYIGLKIGKPDKLITIYEGIDYEQFLVGRVNIKKEDFGFRRGDFIIGSVGRLAPEKGHIYLIEAAAVILKDIPRARFLIIGEGIDRGRLEERCADLGIIGSVRFLGLRKDIPDLLSIMDVFVLPSLYEGLGIAALEAMAAGLPVIATKVGGIPQIITDGESGILVSCANPQAIAQGVNFIFNNPQIAKAMGEEGRRRVKGNFTTKSMVEKIEKLYNEVLYK